MHKKGCIKKDGFKDAGWNISWHKTRRWIRGITRQLCTLGSNGIWSSSSCQGASGSSTANSYSTCCFCAPPVNQHLGLLPWCLLLPLPPPTSVKLLRWMQLQLYLQPTSFRTCPMWIPGHTTLTDFPSQMKYATDLHNLNLSGEGSATSKSL